MMKDLKVEVEEEVSENMFAFHKLLRAAKHFQSENHGMILR